MKKLWNMKVTIVPIVTGALGTITKGLLKGLKDLEETIQMTALLRTARIVNESWSLEEICCHSNSNEKPSPNTDGKNSNGVYNNNNHNNNNLKRWISTSNLLGNWKKLWNMKVTIISLVIGAFWTATKGLLKGLDDLEVGGCGETIETTTLLRTARILRKVLEAWEDLLSLKLHRKTIS